MTKGYEPMFAQAGTALAGVFFILAIVLVFGTVVGAMILRAACSLFNKFAGGRDAQGAVPDPSFGRAVGISFVATLIQMVIAFVLSLATRAGGIGDMVTPAILRLAFLPLSICVLASITTAVLPTSFGKGMLIALIHWAIGAVIGFGLVAVVIAVTMATGMKLGR